MSEILKNFNKCKETQEKSHKLSHLLDKYKNDISLCSKDYKNLKNKLRDMESLKQTIKDKDKQIQNLQIKTQYIKELQEKIKYFESQFSLNIQLTN